MIGELLGALAVVVILLVYAVIHCLLSQMSDNDKLREKNDELRDENHDLRQRLRLMARDQANVQSRALRAEENFKKECGG